MRLERLFSITFVTCAETKQAKFKDMKAFDLTEVLFFILKNGASTKSTLIEELIQVA